MFYRKRERVELYRDIWLDIVVSDENKKLNKEFSYHKNWYACAFTDTWRESKGDEWKRSVVVVLNPHHPRGFMDEYVILHEVVHIKNLIFKRLGIKPDVNNDEHEAYFVEYLYQKVKEFYVEVMEKEKSLIPKKEET